MTDGPRGSDPPPTTLSRTTRLAGTVAPDDPSIPVLTERLTLPPLDLDLDFRLPPLPRKESEDTAAAPAVDVPHGHADAARPPEAPSEERLQQLRESVLLALARDLPVQAEQILQRHLETALQETTQRLTAALRAALAATLREALARAVEAELQRAASPAASTPPAVDP